MLILIKIEWKENASKFLKKKGRETSVSCIKKERKIVVGVHRLMS